MGHKGVIGSFALAASLTSPKALAQEIQASQQADSRKAWSLAVSASWSETPVARDSAEHSQVAGLGVLLSHSLPVADSHVVKDLRVTAEVSWSDEIGFEDNGSDLSNTTISLLGIGQELGSGLEVAFPVDMVLATNADDSRYLGYQGSAILRPGLTYSYKIFRIGSGLSVNRSFYAYDASRIGRFNPTWSFGPYASLGLAGDVASFSASFRNSTVILADGSRRNDKYTASLQLAVEHSRTLASSLAWTQRDRTFGYDGVQPNIDFRYADKTLVSYELTYTY